jgi:YVTN family beta-propeller protein
MLVKLKFIYPVLFIGVLVLSSCKPEDDPLARYEDGVFIVNEGAFNGSNGSISYYSYNSDAITNNIFYTVNERSLGDVVQSLTLGEEFAYIVVNNSNKIEVADKATFAEKSVIEGVGSPRYLVLENHKAYVSCWLDNTVKVIDLDAGMVTNSIGTGSGPEKLLILNEKLYVANSGGWGTDSTISVIDLQNEKVIKEISVNYSPQDMVVDKSGKLWVLATGKIIYDVVDPFPILGETPSKLYQINASTDEVEQEIDLFADEHPIHLEIDQDDNLYFGGGFGFSGIYRISAPVGVMSQITLVVDEYFYGFNIDPYTGIIFALQAPVFSASGVLKRFTTDGAQLGTYECGIGPNSASFKTARKQS